MRFKLYQPKVFKALLSLLIISFGLLVFFSTLWGRSFLKTTLLLPEILPSFPVHPLVLLTRPPVEDQVGVISGSKVIKTYIFRPNDSEKHPAIILMATGFSPTSGTITNYAESFSRIGFATFVPDFPDLSEVKKVSLKPEQVDDLVKIFQTVSKEEFVDSKKVGFLGICAGGSLALVAAEDPSISSQVGFVILVSVYFDGYSTIKQIYLDKIFEDSGGHDWTPAESTVLTADRLLVNSLEDEKDREVLEGFINGKGEEEPTELSQDGRVIYDFIRNKDQNQFSRLWEQLPPNTKKVLTELSPSTKIADLSAHTFILTDTTDSFVPKSEGSNLAARLPKDQRDYIGLDLLEHSQLARKLPRLKTLIEIGKAFIFVRKIFAFVS